MSWRFLLRHATVSICLLAATSGFSQNLPAIPFSIDPAFWGHAHRPYALTLTVTKTDVNGKTEPQTRGSVINAFRDSTGRVCEQTFYNSGQSNGAMIRDPEINSFTMLQTVKKSFVVVILPRPSIPPPGKGWTVERLPSRVIDGFPAEGFRFTRTIPASEDGKKAADTVIDEEWISNELDVVLERKIVSQLAGTTRYTVSNFRQVEPDPVLFTIPADYTLQNTTTQAPAK